MIRSILQLIGATDHAIAHVLEGPHSKVQAPTTATIASDGLGIGSFFGVSNRHLCLHCGRRQQSRDPLCPRCTAADAADARERHVADAQAHHAAHETYHARDEPKPWPRPGPRAFLARRVTALWRCKLEEARAQRRLWALGVTIARQNRLASQVPTSKLPTGQALN